MLCDVHTDILQRLDLFRQRVTQAFSSIMQDAESILLSELVTFVNEGLSTDDLFGTAEATALCQKMQDDEMLMISEGTVFKIS